MHKVGTFSLSLNLSLCFREKNIWQNWFPQKFLTITTLAGVPQHSSIQCFIGSILQLRHQGQYLQNNYKLLAIIILVGMLYGKSEVTFQVRPLYIMHSYLKNDRKMFCEYRQCTLKMMTDYWKKFVNNLSHKFCIGNIILPMQNLVGEVIHKFLPIICCHS